MFLLVAYDLNDRFVGFCHAMFINANEPWIDIMGIYTEPGVGSAVKEEVFEFLKEWGRSRGAFKIYAGLTRKYDTFYRFFHEPLGFRKIGIIVAYDLKEGDNGTRSSTESEYRVHATDPSATHIWTAESVHIRTAHHGDTRSDG